MSRVLTSQSTGAAIYVFSDDHCPPHVHARHRGDGWIVRVRFSYLGSTVELMSIAPLRNAPVQRTVNRLLADIEGALAACRRGWWATRQTTCLANQWAIIRPGEQIELAPAPSASAKQIADAGYDPDNERLLVIFHDGTTADVSTRP
jgi:hypothetical protein